MARVKSARGYFPVVGTDAFDGLAQPSTDRNTVKSCGKGKNGKRKGKSSSQKGGKPPSLGTPGILPKTQSSRAESRPPMSKKRPTEVGATRGGPHHAPRLRPDQCMLCRQVGHVPRKRRLLSLLENVHLVLMLWVVQCSIPRVHGATVEEIEHDQDEEDIEDFVAFSIKSLEGFAILDCGATKTVSGFLSVQPVADRHEDTTIETTDVGFTFARGETEAASTKLCIPHAEFPQGISVNVVSNESTPFLNGLDVLREHGLVIDYHCNRAYSHLLKRYLPCAILPTRHLGLECYRATVNRDSTQWRVVPSPLDTGAYIQEHRRMERLHLSHAYFIFMTRSQNTSTDTLLRAKTIC